jgi:hypothetical protein
MATVATIASQPDTVFGDRRVAWRDVTFSNPYVTGGGESLVPSQVGMGTFAKVTASQVAAGTHIGKSAVYDYTNQKLVALVAANTEATAVDLSAMTVRVEFIGR